ncbi:hypothetical protein QR680_013117 [Steinernema hermaphroditum]|uniref:RRM domain-containing protein n=1 Tax=Steinernema hermaphroditum TaxID=289476 RepID=A0AA39I4F5_9BILA|nr:hypothetical protein QR680_013117 [Steinernema hermaphroditum]
MSKKTVASGSPVVSIVARNSNGAPPSATGTPPPAAAADSRSRNGTPGPLAASPNLSSAPGAQKLVQEMESLVGSSSREVAGSVENDHASEDGSMGCNDPGKMFIGGLSWQTTAEGLRDYFSKFGEVNECMVMRDPATKRARGFGFITFADPKTVDKVLAEENHELDNKKIDPKVAFPKRAQPKLLGANGPRQSPVLPRFALIGRPVPGQATVIPRYGHLGPFGPIWVEEESRRISFPPERTCLLNDIAGPATKKRVLALECLEDRGSGAAALTARYGSGSEARSATATMISPQAYLSAAGLLPGYGPGYVIAAQPVPEMIVKTKKVFIGGLSSTSTLDDMRRYFEQYGKVEDAMLMFDKATQRHRGFGFVTFDNDEVSDKVCEIHFHEINGKMVECKKAQPKEVMLPVQMNKSRAAAARGLYMAPEQLLAFTNYNYPRLPFGNMMFPGMFPTTPFANPGYGGSSGRQSGVPASMGAAANGAAGRDFQAAAAALQHQPSLFDAAVAYAAVSDPYFPNGQQQLTNSYHKL